MLMKEQYVVINVDGKLLYNVKYHNIIINKIVEIYEKNRYLYNSSIVVNCIGIGRPHLLYGKSEDSQQIFMKLLAIRLKRQNVPIYNNMIPTHDRLTYMIIVTHIRGHRNLNDRTRTFIYI